MGLELTIYHTPDEHTYQYTTDAVNWQRKKADGGIGENNIDHYSILCEAKIMWTKTDEIRINYDIFSVDMTGEYRTHNFRL